MILVGTVYGWITISLPGLTSGDNMPLKLTDDEGSWLVSLTLIGSTIGAFMGAIIADRYGRRFCLLGCSGFFILGWSFVLLATNVEILYVSRVILGIGVGIAYTASPMYVSEVADTKIRGTLGCLTAVNVLTGWVFTCLIGFFVSYATLACVFLILPMIFVAIFVWFPESPYYLVAVGRRKEAYRSISYFKGTTKRNQLRMEMKHICKILGRDDSFKPNNRSADMNRQSWLDKIRLMKQPSNRRALCIVIGLITAQQLSGNFCTMQYVESLLTKILFPGPYATSTSVLMLRLSFSILTTVSVETVGRRKFLITSTFGLWLTLSVLSCYLGFFRKLNDMGIDNLAFIDVICYQLLYQFGLGTLTNALLGELFPMEAKSVAGAIVMMFDGILGFTVLKLYQVINDNAGLWVTYTIFMFCSLISFVMVYSFVPETEGKNYQEIRALLTEGKVVSTPTKERQCIEVEHGLPRDEENGRRDEVHGDGIADAEIVVNDGNGKERNIEIVSVEHEEKRNVSAVNAELEEERTEERGIEEQVTE
ncbi:sugar transporter ERD6-like [Frieseomelitta varia]|uniref:sugar transporter ERD6-like n=1 Tax=Frieseomelitta varia TaxID=561572 RepID=UPI001CB6B3F6|nr:sugar transporter ERD6-like [Frieseomelitta varia]